MNISFFELEDWEKDYLKSAFPRHSLSFFNETLNKDNFASVKNTEIISPFIYSSLSKDLLLNFPNLKLIATRSTGFDHIDINYCNEKGIVVCNVPTYGVNTIAEHTFALILALSRKIVSSVEQTKRGNFELAGLRGSELVGKILGIIGLGHIGTRVAEIAQAFKMKVVVYTRHPNSVQKTGITFVDLPTLLSTSDIVSLHLPATVESRHLINKENIKLMKKGSFFINTARGSIVDIEAIFWAFDQKILAGAGLDVLEEECTLKEERQLLSKDFLKTCNLKTQLLNHVILNKKEAIITPHNAFNSDEALKEILITTVNNITGFVSGKFINQVHI